VVDDEDFNLAVAEGITDTGRIIDIVVVATITASDEDVVVTVVDISNDTVTSINTIANSAIIGGLHALIGAVAQIVRLGPVDEAAACIATVVTEPGVEDARIAIIATVGKIHGDGGDGATRLADGVRAGAEVIITPGLTALVPHRRIDAADGRVGGRSNNNNTSKSKNRNKTHFCSEN